MSEQIPLAWLHDSEGRYDVIHSVAKELWVQAGISQQVEHYTIPLYAHPHPYRPQAMSTEEAMELLKKLFGIGFVENAGNMLKLIRAVEQWHKVG
jgi:hypothetical protein